jgi:hypothetical protein
MFKKLGLKILIDFIWKNSKLKVSYNESDKEMTVKFKVDEDDFELLKHGVISKLRKEMKVVTDDDRS